MSRAFRLAAIMAVLALPGFAQDAPAPHRASVGMRARIDQLVLPGSKLEVTPHDDPARPIVLRIVDTWPHGEMFRYDLEFVGLDPGSYDLADYLQRIDGTPVGTLPKIPVEITVALPFDQVEPNPLGAGELPVLGGYRALLWVGGVVWVVGLVAILFVRGRRRDDEATVVDGAAPRTFADRLRPRVAAAIAGTLDAAGKAELERLLVTHWRRRLGLGDASAAVAIEKLRAHPDAGALLRTLDGWLHRPAGATQAPDLEALLAPYRDAPAEGDA